MDMVYFLKYRLDFATYFFECASTPFSQTISDIEAENPPFIPVYDESGEPQYVEEWMDARTGFESVGLTALSMVASSLQLFLNDWVTHDVERRFGVHCSRKNKRGWFHAYLCIIDELGLPVDECPANLSLIEQAVLARNRGQHPDQLTSLTTTHSESDLAKYPSPYFVSESDKRIVELENGEISWWLSPAVYVDKDKLKVLSSEVEKLASWLVSHY